MVASNKSKERRSGSLVTPIVYFSLESLIILLVVYIMTGGSIFTEHGFVMSIVGLAYPLYKLPRYYKRAQLSNSYNSLRRRFT